MSEEDAVHYAQNVVRETHGSANEASLSNIMTNNNEAIRLFTTLYQFMNNTYGQTANFVDAMKTQGIGKPELLARAFATLMVPAMATALVKGEIPDWEDPVSVAEWMGKAAVDETLAIIPIIRDFMNIWSGYRGAGLVAPESLMQQATVVARDVKRAYEGKEVHKPIEDVGNLAGVSLHLPLGQIAKTTQYITDVTSGKEEAPDNPALFALYAANGPPRKEKKE
jgi:hypothetical protein